jgi:hypothetical protein
MPATSIRCSANPARSPPSGLKRLSPNEPSRRLGGDEMQRDRGGDGICATIVRGGFTLTTIQQRALDF